MKLAIAKELDQHDVRMVDFVINEYGPDGGIIVRKIEMEKWKHDAYRSILMSIIANDLVKFKLDENIGRAEMKIK